MDILAISQATQLYPLGIAEMDHLKYLALTVDEAAKMVESKHVTKSITDFICKCKDSRMNSDTPNELPDHDYDQVLKVASSGLNTPPKESPIKIKAKYKFQFPNSWTDI